MTSPLDPVSAALVTAEQHLSTITAERDALIARVNELDDEMARLVGMAARLADAAERALTFLAEESTLETSDWSKAPLEHLRTVVRLSKGGTPDSTSAAGVGGAPLAATAMALELVAECWNGLNEGIGVTFDGLLRDRARELLEGK